MGTATWTSASPTFFHFHSHPTKNCCPVHLHTHGFKSYGFQGAGWALESIVNAISAPASIISNNFLDLIGVLHKYRLLLYSLPVCRLYRPTPRSLACPVKRFVKALFCTALHSVLVFHTAYLEHAQSDPFFYIGFFKRFTILNYYHSIGGTPNGIAGVCAF